MASSRRKSLSRSRENMDTTEKNLIYPLMAMFPEACPNYLRTICDGKGFSETLLNGLATKLLSEDYPRRTAKPPSPEKKISVEEQYDMLKQLLPDADPTYLRSKCIKLVNRPEELKKFIASALEKKDYPTMIEYLKKQHLAAQANQYTVNFNVAHFLEVIPDPVTHFKNTKPGDALSENPMKYQIVYTFLKNEFNTVPVISIGTVLKKTNSMQKAHQELTRLTKNLHSLPQLKIKRKLIPFPDTFNDIPLLQEMAFISHKDEILEYIKTMKQKEREERSRAKKYGLLETCNCCFDSEVLLADTVHCQNGCNFCKYCLQKSVEVAFGEGRLQFPCLSSCSSSFSIQTLQSALNPKLFSKIAHKKQMEEVKAARIEELEMCPFCDFATIPHENDKIFKCLNPECMKESCRQCKEPSHLPYKCDEIEKPDDVKLRIYVENKMTEALLKKCYQCAKSFIKSDGCNKIKCPCGAEQCYLCGEPIEGYDHFNGQGGTNFHLCPLYSETEEMHEQAVLKAAENAKAVIGVSSKKQLKVDPTKDLKEHYAELKKKAQPLPPGIVNYRVRMENNGNIRRNPNNQTPQRMLPLARR